MDADFPAAHSMDTEWFAVDQDGQVALFLSGENGTAPVGVEQGDIDAVLRALGGALPPQTWHYELVLPELARLGLHVYDDASGWFAGPYRRAHRPGRPLHVDQLPPPLRRLAKAVRFEGLRFADKELLQPCDYVAGTAWGAAYLAEDGQTVRPIPGHEGHCAQFRESFRQYHPDEFKKYRFEGPDETG